MAMAGVSSPATHQVLAPGDRFAIVPLGGNGEIERFSLPEVFSLFEVPIERVTDPSGQALTVRRDAPSNSMFLPHGVPRGPNSHGEWWLEFAERGEFRLVPAASDAVESASEVKTEHGIPISFDPEDWNLLRPGVPRRLTVRDLELALQAAKLGTHAGFDRLICLPLVRDMELLEHQTRTARTVLQRHRGRAMLCDEVGLGKTIEAGLIFAELKMRGLIRSALVIVPPSLIEQWQGEMRRKFSLELTSHDDPAFRAKGIGAWQDFDLVIASLHTAKREPHRSAILERKWDLVIVDEAHHLRNRTTQAWRFASELQKQYMLLLTATPVQNNLDELFNLVTLLEPGLLRTSKQFQRQFVDRKDKLTPKNVEELHRLLSEVMVRNRRSTVGLQFTRRWAKTERVAPHPGERQLYDDAAAFVRAGLQSAGKKGALNRMALLSLQMALGSSCQAAGGVLANLADNSDLAEEDRSGIASLAERALKQADSAKADRLLGLVTEYGDKMVVFTQFRATQEMLRQRLEQAGRSVTLFHGGLSRLAKEDAIRRFRGPAQVLLATEAGSEGRNLQFAHAVCNFDLPWNPMRIEQRIGRLSRIGQTHDVHVFNLVAAGTVEASILHLLEAKLNLFELVIGEIDMILGNLDDEREFQEVIADLWAESADGDDFHRRMEDLGNRLQTAKAAYLEQRNHDDRIFGDRFAPDQ
jgi:SNF2 family DNA or RNA helicase